MAESSRYSRFRPLGVAMLCCMVALLSACGTPLKRNPAPSLEIAKTSVMASPGQEGIHGIRGWGDTYSPILQQSLIDAIIQTRTYFAIQGLLHPGKSDILALSGGGPDGAFGAGVLCGWSDNGTRPDFRVVTGVSTGALSAPFVFLGQAYDNQLRKLYTTTTSEDIFEVKGLLSILGTDSVTDTAPLLRLLEEWVNQDMLEDIAAEHKKGRRLFIATTNMDAQRNVVWDMGAIAASGHPRARELFHKVMLASASIPVFFPPVYIPVETDGQYYDEMHVDGGVISQFIVYDAYLDPKRAAQQLGNDLEYNATTKNVHIIINNTIGPQRDPVAPTIVPIAGRSISTLIKSQAKGALAYAYLLTLRDDMTMRYIAIPDDFKVDADDFFDPEAMDATFRLGYEFGINNTGWQTLPPGYEE